MAEAKLKPIGYFLSEKKSRLEAARQAEADTSSAFGIVRLTEGSSFEQALEDLEGFSKIWLIYGFHQNTRWKPKVDPPRSPGHKVGVFASRSPYRPNALGLSCVSLLKVQGLELTIGAHDILDGTPIYDIKPYLTYSDSFPEARMGWLETPSQQLKNEYSVQFSALAESQLEFLKHQGLSEFRPTLVQQLQFDPFNSQKKRIKVQQNYWIFSYKTWRAEIHAHEKILVVSKIFSGYSEAELISDQDPYLDKLLHRTFIKAQ